MRLSNYIILIDQFVNGKLSVEDFQRQYFSAYKLDGDITSSSMQKELWQLFTDIDCYSPSIRPGSETKTSISEEKLRSQAKQTLMRLLKYEKQENK